MQSHERLLRRKNSQSRKKFFHSPFYSFGIIRSTINLHGMTPKLNPKILASFELIDLLHERSQLLKRMLAQEPNLDEHLQYIKNELKIFEQ